MSATIRSNRPRARASSIRWFVGRKRQHMKFRVVCVPERTRTLKPASKRRRKRRSCCAYTTSGSLSPAFPAIVNAKSYGSSLGLGSVSRVDGRRVRRSWDPVSQGERVHACSALLLLHAGTL